MTQHELLTDEALERSEIVANNRMNRERGLRGNNSYSKDLGIDPLHVLCDRLQTQERTSWLDLCCGSGRALIEAGLELQSRKLAERVSLLGIDLVAMFALLPAPLTCVRLEEASLATWRPDAAYDLITCVHGLHYIGDKLGLIAQAVSWLKPGGLFAAHLDYANLRLADNRPLAPFIGKQLRAAGLEYLPHKRILICRGQKSLQLPYRYLGADDSAGPNYTGQPAVNSYYSPITTQTSG
jgi:SAM-dependent methyltransferase